MGGVLKTFVLSGASGRVNFGITSSEDKIFVKNIKGKTLGKTLNVQALIPLSEHEMYFAGLKIIQHKKNNLRRLVPT